MFIGTPKGRNFFYDIFKLGKSETDPDWKSWHFTTKDNPLIDPTEIESAKKTSRVIVVDEGHQSFGTTSEIASRINEKAFYYLDAPALRMGAMDVPIPFSPALEDITVPTAEGVAENARKLVRGELIHAA